MSYRVRWGRGEEEEQSNSILREQPYVITFCNKRTLVMKADCSSSYPEQLTFISFVQLSSSVLRALLKGPALEAWWLRDLNLLISGPISLRCKVK